MYQRGPLGGRAGHPAPFLTQASMLENSNHTGAWPCSKRLNAPDNPLSLWAPGRDCHCPHFTDKDTERLGWVVITKPGGRALSPCFWKIV